MKRKWPKWTHGYIDRHDRPRFYLRRPGHRKVPLPGLPWSPEFMAAREAALKGEWGKQEIGAKRTVEGTVSAALVTYYGSQAFEGLAPLTQQNRRAILEGFRAEHGDKRVGLMPADVLQHIVGKKTPAAQRNFRKAMRGFVDHCVAEGMIKTDPLAGLKLSKMKKTRGHPTWTEDDVGRYQQHHAPGTKARLALELLLQTGHARADVVRMGRQHVRNGTLSMRRQKTDVQFDIPLLPDLVAELARHPMKDHLTFLVTSAGKPFTAGGFGIRFRGWCDAAGLKHLAAHGLRKCAAIRHALNGATAPELMAWFGWKTIGEAQRYIEEANRIRLAKNAGARFISRTAAGSPGTPVSQTEP
jgi:integrase